MFLVLHHMKSSIRDIAAHQYFIDDDTDPEIYSQIRHLSECFEELSAVCVLNMTGKVEVEAA